MVYYFCIEHGCNVQKTGEFKQLVRLVFRRDFFSTDTYRDGRLDK